jgi:integrase
MGPQHLHDDAIEVRQQKTSTNLKIPLHAELKRVIESTPSGHLTFLVTKDGKSFSPSGFGNWFGDCCKQAGLDKRLRSHGLRKAMCRRLAEAGCSAHEIAAISGHKSLREVERYTKAADQLRMAKAAMNALGAKTATSSGKPK